MIDEQHAEPRLEILQPLQPVLDHEVERAQTEDGQQVRDVDVERIVRDRQHRRDRVEGEDHVGQLDDHQHQEQQRDHALAVLAGEEVARVRLFGQR